MKLIPVGLAFIVILAITSSANADVFFTETFDDSSGFTTSTPFFSDDDVSTGDDFFGLGGTADDWGGDSTPSGLKAYTGFVGGILTGMDLDGEGASLPVTVDWTGIDITGRTGLEFAGDFAEFFDAPGDIDATDQLFVEAQIDGGGYVTILEFTPGAFTSGDSVNGFFFNDGVQLGNAAQNFTGAIAGTGTTLDLRLTINLNAGDEDFGADNFTLRSDAVPEPGSMVVLGLVGLTGLLSRRRR